MKTHSHNTITSIFKKIIHSTCYLNLKTQLQIKNLLDQNLKFSCQTNMSMCTTSIDTLRVYIYLPPDAQNYIITHMGTFIEKSQASNYHVLYSKI